MGGLVRAMSGGSGFQAWRNKLLVVAVYEQGSVVGLADDPGPFHFRYDEVARFVVHVAKRYVNQSYRGLVTNCWVGLEDDRNHRFQGQGTRNELSVVEDFRQLVDPRIAAAQLPRMLGALRQGRPVDFGAYVLDQRGITTGTGNKQKQLPWAQVGQVGVDLGSVEVKERDRRRAWATANTTRVPNLTAFLTLAREAQRGL
ncbi:DUF6585 family protein [Streptomyces sp. NBC_01198]|uniref:DUF6585 family protein n=1 Tax=Streptomyces sp. NBC_01198 TaxID=2903769 RepID=UPI002E135618|nr:hypothetical protein OG702_10580 [Streptomyces sp. NBC_01198]